MKIPRVTFAFIGVTELLFRHSTPYSEAPAVAREGPPTGGRVGHFRTFKLFTFPNIQAVDIGRVSRGLYYYPRPPDHDQAGKHYKGEKNNR